MPILIFGSSTLVDFLSWIVAISLAAKVVATAILLITGKDNRDRPGWGTVLWWVTKITPVVAAPCLVWLALRYGTASDFRIYLLLLLFVIVAVPLKIWQRHRRILGMR